MFHGAFQETFKKDPMFVGREAVISSIKEVHKAIGRRHERVALVGLAGVGLAVPKESLSNNN